MKKLFFSKWLFVALAMLNVLSLSADTLKFKAVTSNVDGLPPSVTIAGQTANFNEDGSQEPGATRMGQLIAENLWDIVALSEDFNYHDNIMSGVSSYYNASKHRGKIEEGNLDGSVVGFLSKSVRMNTDGLCLLTRKKYSVSPDASKEGDGSSKNPNGNNWVLWNDHYGYTDHEADGAIRKGFRFYQVTLADGYVIDVYITHMEAGSDPEDNAARAKQLKQFADYITAHKGTNPIIILGDTNCRYTRDPLKTDFIDAINADPDLEIHDPWVDLMWDGVYPTPNSGALMVSQYGEQKGEVVDKVFYINNAKSECTLSCEGYLHDDSFTYADGGQIADHYPVVASMVITGPKEIVKAGFEYPEPTGTKEAVKSGTTYFLRNVGSGEFLRAGGAWTTQAVMGDYPSKVIPASKGGDKYSLKTTHDNKWLRYAGPDYYMDQDENEWTLTQVKDNIYTLTDASGNAVSHANGVMAKAASADATDPNQQWEFLTEANLRDEIYYATTTDPKDVTFLMKAPDFGYADQELSGWTVSFPKGSWKTNNAKAEKIRVNDQNNISMYKLYHPGSGNDNRWVLSQTVSGLPAGTYVVTYQMLTYNLAEGGNLSFKINGTPVHWTNVGSDPGSLTVAQNMAVGLYAQSVTVTVDNSGKIEFLSEKAHNGSAVGAYFDNFKIKCIGIAGKPDMTVYDRVKIAIDDAQAKADAMGLGNHYRNNQVVALWEEQGINGDGWAEVKRTYKNLAEAVLGIKTIPADYTYAIVNNSFELYPDYNDGTHTIDGGFPLGWSYPTTYAKDSGVWPANDENKKVSNADGDYIFNSYPQGNAVIQEVTLTPGIYTLTAKVASDDGNKVFLYANGKNTSVTTTGGNEFVTVSLNFPVTDSKPFDLGVAGAKNGAFATTGGVWFKADDFHLTRIHTAEVIKGMEFLQLAINDVKTKSKKYGDKTEIALSKYQALLDTYTLVGDGSKEVSEIYNLLAERVYAQEGNRVEFTDVIVNNSFEWKDTYGWTLSLEGGDTSVKANSDSGYKISNANGSYIFNTWTNGVGADIYQTLPLTLPVGHYELKAVFATDNGARTFLGIRTADGEYLDQEIFTSTGDKGVGIDRTFAFDIYEEIPGLMIVAGGVNGQWYKVDNFRLYKAGAPQVCKPYKELQKAIDYTKAQAATLPEKYASQWNVDEFQAFIDEHCSDGHDHVNGAASDKDPLHNDATEQIKALYAKFSAFVFSQTEVDADFTPVIVNPSFETGDLTGWSLVADAGTDCRVTSGLTEDVYRCEGVDGTYLLNVWKDNTAHPIYQVIPNVPAGKYALSLKLSSYAGLKFFIGANYQHSDIITINTDEFKFTEYELIFDIPESEGGKDLKIGLYPTEKTNADEITEADFADDALGPWYKADDFHLRRPGVYREIEWSMEGEANGTIIMPFVAEVPEGYIAYTITGIGEEKEIPYPNDEELQGKYQVLTLEPVTVLEAHKAYFIQKIDAEAGNEPRLRAAEPENIIFSGLHATESNLEPNGMLAGTYAVRTALEGEYHLNETATHFKKATDGNLPEVAAHHAYIPAESGATADYLFFTDEDVPTGVEELLSDDAANADIYTTGGVLVRSNVKVAEALGGLDSGIYIIRCGNRTFKVIKK